MSLNKKLVTYLEFTAPVYLIEVDWQAETRNFQS